MNANKQRHQHTAAHGHRRAPTALGIDIGRVIIAPSDSAGDTSFLNGSEAAAMKTPQNPGAFETIAELARVFEGRVWIVSKCGPRVAARSRRWLTHHQFFERTGVPSDQLRFCRKRGDKAPICASLGLDAFIDDRPDVLLPMVGIVPWRFLFGHQRRGAHRPELIAVRNWKDVGRQLLPMAGEIAEAAATLRPASATAPSGVETAAGPFS